MPKAYLIKREIMDDEKLWGMAPEDLRCFNWLNVVGQNVAEEHPDVFDHRVWEAMYPRG